MTQTLPVSRRRAKPAGRGIARVSAVRLRGLGMLCGRYGSRHRQHATTAGAMTDPTEGRPAGHRRHGRADAAGGGFGAALVRHRWHAVIGVGVVAAVLVGGAIYLAKGHDERLVANGCGMVNCSATLPGADGASASPQA